MLVVDGVSKRFGSISVLSQVSLTVGSGEIVALVGENGAGKSSLVRCIARAITPDSGTVTIDGAELGRTPADAIAQGLAVVWQDLALCDNLDVTANLFLGRELAVGGAIRPAAMRSRATRILDDLGASIPGVDLPLDRLSGGQRQLVAIARATLDRPRVLILDEPTAALGLAESRAVLSVVERLRAAGVAVMLVSHQLDQVFDVADRIVVLRHGELVADLHRTETHPDDVVALITGADVETMAGKQLRRLHSLAEQLSDAERSSVLPLTVSSLSAALNVDELAVFLTVLTPDGIRLRRSAGLHLTSELDDRLTELAVGQAGGFVGLAAERCEIQIVPDLDARSDDPVASLAAASGVGGAWAAPIVGQRSCLAVIVGFTDGLAQLQWDQIQLLELFSTMAGAAIERGLLVDRLRTRNRSLSGLQAVLEALAGPDLISVAMDTALAALCKGVDADYTSLLVSDGNGEPTERASATCLDEAGTVTAREAARLALDKGATGVDRTGSDRFMVLSPMDPDPPVNLAGEISVVRFTWSRGIGALVCVGARTGPETAQVMEGAARTLGLALEREVAAGAEREAMALQRSRATERAVTRRLGHELRTPLTAIRGFASTMLQTDVEWGDADKQRFLEIIESEAGRMARLVDQLFDDSALESGTLRLDVNYCDLVTIVDRAVSIVRASDHVATDLPPLLTVWGDNDRLEQLLVNLIDNAVRHNPAGTSVTISARSGPRAGWARVEVSDSGGGLPDDVRRFYNGHSDELDPGRGLGVRLARGFVLAHGGTVLARSGRHGTTIDIDLPTEDTLLPEPVEEAHR